MHRLPFITLTLLAALSGVAAAEPITLQQAIATALEHNPDLRLSQLGVEGAAAQQTIAGAAPNPTLTLQSFNINPNAGVGAGGLRSKTVDSALRVDQLIERGGKRELRIENANSLAAASGSDLRETRRQVQLLVSQAYYDLLAADARLAITRESAQLFDRTVDAARKRQQAGDLAPADVARAQVDALRARNDVLQAESDLFLARQTLALLIGEPGAQLTALDAWPDAPAGTLAGATPAAIANGVASTINDGSDDGALARRPDVLAAQARFDAAQAARKLALASRSADVTVGLQFEHYPTSITNTQGSGNSFGIALQIPLFVRYGYDGEIRAADVALDTARENMHQARVQAQSELELSQERVRSAADKLRRYDASGGGDSIIGAAKKSADAAEFAFQRGALGIMDLLDVRRTYRAAQLEALAARADYAKSLAALQAATSEGK
jgi:cobalt-zinc-cadmium efflux system outer membrane protein